jgi:hypothetical protein
LVLAIQRAALRIADRQRAMTMLISERRQIFIAERSRARKSQLLWSVMTQAPIAGPVGCITVANALSRSRSLPALATLGLTPNTCAADWLEPNSVAFEQHLNEIDRIAGERPIERYINKATKSG